MPDFLRIENFLSPEEISTLLTLVDKDNLWEGGGGEFWANRAMNVKSIYDNGYKDQAALMARISHRIAQALAQRYNKEILYPDLLQLIRWFPGQEQLPHWDDMTGTEGNGWFAHREFGVIIYLNDDYQGGHTYYPELGVDMTPLSGALIAHPGNREHLHGVTKIEGSTRYTLASFWTTDQSYAHDYNQYL